MAAFAIKTASSPLRDQLSEQEKEIEVLVQAIDCLRDKLDPLLRDEPQRGEIRAQGEVPRPAPQSQALRQLEGNTARLVAARRAINSLIQQTEV